mmetsp:Transcript_21486/g.38859  ORF Transcript_21486/g.38859 Transcript_21486/m.38859 type:complete len:128 (-) Transcript_21486:610-993(-)|eukprot:CAMPEP_0198281708 /NCGR_PEP_ID=MMETSP1449-20131203/1609_1 /TAXON_ID=420275 /ORGANISM="Attheya septentrionalis, Strain CCMP2084" /LENGTH=127 /DNA_ID=CAMNT_0043977609 /DNA_START=373 /DNA_END=756 /DNA_ORIENTATION=+
MGFYSRSIVICVSLVVIAIVQVKGFVPVAFSRPASTMKSMPPGQGEGGRLEEIEYTIYPDGRVEEIVRGIKGASCHTVTDQINEALGEVVSTRPTEEMYEQEITLDNTIEITEGSSSSDGNTWDNSW